MRGGGGVVKLSFHLSKNLLDIIQSVQLSLIKSVVLVGRSLTGF